MRDSLNEKNRNIVSSIFALHFTHSFTHSKQFNLIFDFFLSFLRSSFCFRVCSRVNDIYKRRKKKMCEFRVSFHSSHVFQFRQLTSLNSFMLAQCLRHVTTTSCILFAPRRHRNHIRILILCRTHFFHFEFLFLFLFFFPTPMVSLMVI